MTHRTKLSGRMWCHGGERISMAASNMLLLHLPAAVVQEGRLLYDGRRFTSARGAGVDRPAALAVCPKTGPALIGIESLSAYAWGFCYPLRLMKRIETKPKVLANRATSFGGSGKSIGWFPSEEKESGSARISEAMKRVFTSGTSECGKRAIYNLRATRCLSKSEYTFPFEILGCRADFAWPVRHGSVADQVAC